MNPPMNPPVNPPVNPPMNDMPSGLGTKHTRGTKHAWGPSSRVAPLTLVSFLCRRSAGIVPPTLFCFY